MSAKEFYIYAILDTRKPGPYQYGHWKFAYEPVYIGKGKGNRGLQSLNDSSKSYKARKFAKMRREGYEPELVYKKINMTEKQAFALECKLIKVIGRLDNGPLTNLTDGGEGMSGYAWSSEEKAHISKSLTGKKQSAETVAKRVAKNKGQKRSAEFIAEACKRRASEETRARMSIAQKGRKFSEEHRQRMKAARAKYVTSKEFSQRMVQLTYKGKTESLRYWEKETSIKYNTLLFRLRNGWKAKRIIETEVGLPVKHTKATKERLRQSAIAQHRTR